MLRFPKGICLPDGGGRAVSCPVESARLNCQLSQNRQLQPAAGSRNVRATARRGRVEPEPLERPAVPYPAADPTTSTSASTAGGAGPSNEEFGAQQRRKASSRRQQFGPEPPPALSDATVTSVAPPKRRGRPPKPRGDAPSTAAPPQSASGSSATPTPAPSPSLPSPTSTEPQSKPQSKPQPEASPAPAAAAGPRTPFGPQPPPPPPPAASGPTGPLPRLPEDPSQLTPDDILDLPLPDSDLRLDDPVRFIRENLMPDQPDDDEDEDEDEELDYDELIALASRVNSASFIQRAFEQAEKRGLQPEELEDELGLGGSGGRAAAEEVMEPVGTGPSSVGSSSSTTTTTTTTTAITTTSAAQAVQDDSRAAPSSMRSKPPAVTGAYVQDLEEQLDAARAAASAGSAASTAEPGQEPALSPEEEAAGRRRVELLVDLIAASGAELEAKLDAVAHEVDEQMLVLLQRRYMAAVSMGQDAAMTERLAGLLQALKYAFQRRNSSPAERLLDDVLSILGDDTLQPDPERRRQDAAARMRNAFTGGMLDIDLFTAAAALAEHRQQAAEQLAGEQVSPEAFKAETLGLMNHARRVQQQTADSIATIEEEAERLRTEDPAALRTREWRMSLEQVALARKALSARQRAIEELEEVLLLARAIEMQMLTGRMSGRE